MKVTLVAAVALFSLTSTAVYAAGSEDYPEPIARPIMSTMPGADVGPNGAAFNSAIHVQLDNSHVILNNSSEAEADSINSFPDRPSDRPIYAAQPREGNHG